MRAAITFASIGMLAIFSAACAEPASETAKGPLCIPTFHCIGIYWSPEGGGQNVRIWGNYIENSMMALGNASVIVGPLYFWNNVGGRSYTPPGSSYNMSHGYFMKMGNASGPMTGQMYVFNNTIFQPKDEGYHGLGGDSKPIHHCMSRNNILNARTGDRHSIAVGEASDNDFDYDLISGAVPAKQEAHGIKGTPKYVEGAGFSLETKTGIFQLAPDSPGISGAVIIPNFCDATSGGPYLGAHPPGAKPMMVGLKAVFNPPAAMVKKDK